MKGYNLDFKRRLKDLHLTQKEFASMIHYGYGTVRNILWMNELSKEKADEWNHVLDVYEKGRKM